MSIFVRVLNVVALCFLLRAWPFKVIIIVIIILILILILIIIIIIIINILILIIVIIIISFFLLLQAMKPQNLFVVLRVRQVKILSLPRSM